MFCVSVQMSAKCHICPLSLFSVKASCILYIFGVCSDVAKCHHASVLYRCASVLCVCSDVNHMPVLPSPCSLYANYKFCGYVQILVNTIILSSLPLFCIGFPIFFLFRVNVRILTIFHYVVIPFPFCTSELCVLSVYSDVSQCQYAVLPSSVLCRLAVWSVCMFRC